jgi:hypothetical protein
VGRWVKLLCGKLVMGGAGEVYFSSISCYGVIVRSSFLPHLKRQSDVSVSVRQCLDVPSNMSW